MLVKGRFYRSAGVHGYDGDAAELVHISTDGVAVVALVHDGESVWPEMGLEEWFALIEIRDVRAGEDETQRVAQGIASEVDLGREAGFGASHGLG